MRILLVLLLILSPYSFASEVSALEKSINSFCAADAKPESLKVCRAYVKMMILHAHHVGYASAICMAGKSTEVDCKQISNSDSDIEKLLDK